MTIQDVLPSVFDRRAAAVAVPITADLVSLLRVEEREGIRGAVPKRQHEFAAGRRCAHLAMAQLGCPAAPVAVGDDRAPIWPEGLVGSISHCEAWAAAVVARKADGIRSIGLDLEPALPLPQDLVQTILRPEECLALGLLPVETQLQCARLIFSAKEAFFKCQYALTGAFIDFQAAAISLDLARRSFRAVLTGAVGAFPAGHSFDGRFHCDAPIMVTGVTLEA
ncbi:4'-phosphopantetheinyl transferase superfamily protein [Bosea sp. 124]|uniref:4'-phosphopantetheinyl transferase family protein n=1 Tax=Bosea sp. 124 TaxID=2135642 RepID=UPI000D384927|nr:4'-phosphopantetheinyl transferase superfamily protein [Bosea sp. 124]PTM41488.1 4'-phosphopantetheinyl transferase EntD [Bosea sp. 124]